MAFLSTGTRVCVQSFLARGKRRNWNPIARLDCSTSDGVSLPSDAVFPRLRIYGALRQLRCQHACLAVDTGCDTVAEDKNRDDVVDFEEFCLSLALKFTCFEGDVAAWTDARFWSDSYGARDNGQGQCCPLQQE